MRRREERLIRFWGFCGERVLGLRVYIQVGNLETRVMLSEYKNKFREMSQVTLVLRRKIPMKREYYYFIIFDQ